VSLLEVVEHTVDCLNIGFGHGVVGVNEGRGELQTEPQRSALRPATVACPGPAFGKVPEGAFDCLNVAPARQNVHLCLGDQSSRPEHPSGPIGEGFGNGVPLGQAEAPYGHPPLLVDGEIYARRHGPESIGCRHSAQ